MSLEFTLLCQGRGFSSLIAYCLANIRRFSNVLKIWILCVHEFLIIVGESFFKQHGTLQRIYLAFFVLGDNIK